MEDVLEVYTRPYDASYPLVCMDETSIQHIKEVRLPIPPSPGRTACYDTEYERNGVSNLFIFFEPLAGTRYINITDRRTAIDWAYQIQELVDIRYPDAAKIVLVMDNLNTHAGASLYKAFPPQEARRIFSRLEIHYTPKHGSWLNMAEIELSILSKQCFGRRIPDQQTLRQETGAWAARRNACSSSMEWRFTTENARVKLKRLYPSLIV